MKLGDKPWLSDLAIRIFEHILPPGAVVFEWGAGASTLWLAERCQRIVTVEHSPTWADLVSKMAFECDLANVSVYRPKCENTMRGYTLHIHGYPDDCFDVVFVDGKWRVECIFAAILHIKPGGWLVLDDSERTSYRPGTKALDGWERITTGAHKEGSKKDQIVWTETTFFQRPITV